MESLNFNLKWTKIKTVAAAAVMLLVFCMVLPTTALGDQKPITADKSRDSQKIHITSDRLESQPNDNMVEFIGNVRAKQENTNISSDSLKIYYRGGMGGKGGEDAINKIVAQGNVIIKIDDRIAVADRAEYSPKSGSIILTGKGAKISQGANFVAGEKITFNRNTNRVTVQRTGNKRVEAVFFSESAGPKEAKTGNTGKTKSDKPKKN